MGLWMVGVMLAVAAAPALGQPLEGTRRGDDQRAGTSMAGTLDAPATRQEAVVSFEDQVVVTASRADERLIDAPAAITILSSDAIASAPAGNLAQILRRVPGLNVAQLSARDVNVSARGATGSLATSQLALVDGRTIYLDFFGMVMWDLVPLGTEDIERIEVIRGPASAMWGANAMGGVVNIITKSSRRVAAEDRESLRIGVSGFARGSASPPRAPGLGLSVHGTHARVLDERWSYRMSAGYQAQEAWPRPTGRVPNGFATPYPAYANRGTSRPTFDVRIDRDDGTGGTTVLAAGVAGTSGVIHSGLGPFAIAAGSSLTYMSARRERGGRRVAVFANLVDGDASSLLSRSLDGGPLPLAFRSRTFDAEASDRRTVGTNHLLSYGGNLRHSTFRVSLAPAAGPRTEGGGYVQDEIFLGARLRWVVGSRMDAGSALREPVLSPRTTLLVKPGRQHTLRLSFNRAFRAPSIINTSLAAGILETVRAGAGVEAQIPVRAVGQSDLGPERMTAWEAGYAGSAASRMLLSAAVYRNVTRDRIAFVPVAFYTSAFPPPGLPATFPASMLDRMHPPLPASFAYRKLGTVVDRGIELGAEVTLPRGWRTFANGAWQATPITRGLDAGTVNRAPRVRLNAGITIAEGRQTLDATVAHAGSAWWQDVLDARYAGTTRAYTLLDAAYGVMWRRGTVTTVVKVSNALGTPIQQHVFGDVIGRQVTGELRVRRAAAPRP